jgi:hemoglobin
MALATINTARMGSSTPLRRHATRRSTLAAIVAALALAVGASNCIAQQAPPAAPNFYQELGGKPGIDSIVTRFTDLMLADQRVKDTFEGVDLVRFRSKLAEQFCVASGGPCSYTGKSMAESHEDLKVTNTQFNASVEHLQAAMEASGVGARTQNRLLARLAPTQHAIVTK